MEHSSKIAAFFAAHGKEYGFWDFAHGYRDSSRGFWKEFGLWDEYWYNEGGHLSEEVPRAFKNGYELAKRAGDKPVFYFETNSNGYYFIGEEDEIVAKLEKIWETEILLNPPPTEEELEEAKNKRRREEIEKKKQALEKELEDLRR